MSVRAHVTSTPPYISVDVHVRSVYRAAKAAAHANGCFSVRTEASQFGDVTVSAACPTAIAKRRFQARVQKVMRRFQKAHRRGKIRLEG